MFVFGGYSWFLAVCAAMSTAVAVLVRRRHDRPATRALFWMGIAIAEWAAAIAVESAATTVHHKLLWSQIAYPGTTTVPILFFLLAVLYCCNVRRIPRWLLWGLFVFPVATCIVAFSNPFHHLVWTRITIQPGSNLAVYEHGPWWYALIGYSYTHLAAAVAVLVIGLFRLPRSSRPRLGILLFGGLFPLAGNLVYVSGHNPIPGFDWTLAGFAASGLVVAWAVLRMQLLKMIPIARNAVIDEMGDGVLVIDREGIVVDTNRSLGRILAESPPPRAGAAAGPYLDILGIPLDTVFAGETASFDTRLFPGRLALHIRAHPVSGGGEIVGAVLVFHDVTDVVRLREERSLLREQVQEARSEIMTLAELLPICANCKRVRDDQGYWQSVESYIREHADIRFSHGLCPQCIRAELDEDDVLELGPDYGLDRIID